MKPPYRRVGRLDELLNGPPKVIRIEDRDVVILKSNGSLFAVSNVCAHQHVSVLHSGIAGECSITCPRHGWTYDLRTGRATTGNGSISTYPLIVSGDEVFIDPMYGENASSE